MNYPHDYWRLCVLIFCFLFSYKGVGQVGINTSNPSPAAVLDVNSSNDGINFGGFLPPKVSLTQRNNIPVGTNDDGLMVFLSEGTNRCLQIYDAIESAWSNVYCMPVNDPVYTLLAGWNVSPLTGGSGNYGPSPFAATATSPSVIVGGLIRGAGIGTGGSGATGAWGGNSFNVTTKANAITNNKFATFTITPSSGENVSITDIDPYNIRRSGTGPTTGIWQYSINGVDFFDIGSPITWGGTTSAAGNLQPAMDLSGIPALQNLTSATTVTFRLVNWGASAAGGTWYLNNFQTGDDLIVRGYVN